MDLDERDFASIRARCQSRADRFSLMSPLAVWNKQHVSSPSLQSTLSLGMNPGTPVSTTALNRTRVLIPSLISCMAS